MIHFLSSKSRVAEVLAVCMRILGAFKNTTLSSDVHLASIFTKVEELIDHFTIALKRTKAKSELKQKDEVRDEKVRSLYYLVLGFLHHPVAKIKAAAQQIETIFNKYGVSITEENYAVESALIASLLGDLTAPELQEAIGKISGLETIITEVDTAQNDFESCRITYEEEKAKESTQKNASLIKAEALELVNDNLIIYLRAMQQVDATNFDAFARTIATIIDDNNEVVKKRNAKPDPDPDPDIDPETDTNPDPDTDTTSDTDPEE